MADSMDLSQEQQDILLAAQIAQARRPSTTPSAYRCEECDDLIPEARRRALPGVTCCVACQTWRENRRR
ncbi:transcriptional regulator, TraR/DksA family [Musicola paradisiaca Ech703]|uniref:Transcriptional regulator, TraR/DksA family n=2 Tax=Musicola paradisiaca TaxID=69223 RepID=C6C6X8_MUSP7|nr:transcriptional regulator, TraR/DksA family [Musicola paradisiaca Ech703]